MKKIKYLLCLLISLFTLPFVVNAASGTISVSGTSTVVEGNTVTITVTLSSSTPIGSWEMDLKYDKNYLKLTSSSAEAGGTYMANVTSTISGVKSKSYTFKFKTLKKGSTNVSISSYYVVDNNMQDMSISAGSKSIKIITQQELEASYSKDNNLKSLGIEGFELSPEFNKDTLEYNVVVPEDTKEININAKANDSKSTIAGLGKHEVSSGANSFEIVVRAESGAEKTYKINVDVKDSNPITVDIDGQEYTVVKLKENLTTPDLFEETTVTINGFEVPAFKNEKTGIVLVGLKNTNGEIELYMYDENKNEYSVYNELNINKINIYPLETNEELVGYTKGEVKINDLKVNGYYFDKNSRFVVIYGINMESGEKGFYMYDKENGSIVKYNDEYIKVLNEKIDLYSYIIVGFSGICLILLLILIFRKPKKRKNKYPKVTKVSFEEDDSKNEIVEIKDDSDEKNYENVNRKGKKKKR